MTAIAIISLVLLVILSALNITDKLLASLILLIVIALGIMIYLDKYEDEGEA